MTTDNASQDDRQPIAGERLRKAREAAGLTVAEVADRQHLRPAVILAIESGDYRQIDSELFLKGYVRVYASQVGLDPDSVVRQLDRELEPLREEQKAKVEENPLVTIERRKRRKRRIARIVAVLVLLAALFFAGSLYLAQQQAVPPPEPGAETGEPDPEPEEADAPEPASGDSAEPAPGNDGPAPEQAGADGDGMAAPAGAPEPGPEADNSVREPEPADDSGSAGPAGQEPVVTLARNNDAAVETAREPEPDTGDESGTGAGGDEPEPRVSGPIEVEESPEAASVTGGDGQLVVEFSDDCWVEVRDSEGRTLAARLYSEGETLEVAGEPPLQVVLGAVNAVASVRYDGERVDLADRRARNNRLALSLPE